jgi:hypothetical protein
MHKIAVRFQGDSLDLGSGLKVNARIVNSRGHVRSKQTVKLSAHRSLRLDASSDGKLARGTVTLAGTAARQTVTVNELGVSSDGAEAWLRGGDRHGHRSLVHLERVAHGRQVRIEIVGGVNLTATVPAKQLSFARA